MSCYLLNSPVLTAFGSYVFHGPLSPEVARAKIPKRAISAIGHETTALFLSWLLDMPVEPARIMVRMEPGDTALVLKLLERLPEGKVLGVEELKGIPFELGWLERIV